jgi:hypothetical protein
MGSSAFNPDAVNQALNTALCNLAIVGALEKSQKQGKFFARLQPDRGMVLLVLTVDPPNPRVRQKSDLHIVVQRVRSLLQADVCR